MHEGFLTVSNHRQGQRDHQARARALTAYWIRQARAILAVNARQLPIPVVRFDLKGKIAGQAVLPRRGKAPCHIRINHQLLGSHPREILERTVPHEVAHVAMHQVHGHRVRPHGPEWKALMQAFGVDASTRHDLPARAVRRLRHFRYRCGCEEDVWLTSIRHNRVMSGAQYRCRRCGEPLQPVDGEAD